MKNIKLYNFIAQILIYTPIYIYIFHSNIILYITDKISKNQDVIFILMYSIWGTIIYNIKTKFIGKKIK